MAATLNKILEEARARVARSRAEVPLRELAAQAEKTVRPSTRFKQALEDAVGSRGIAVIAELKKASPSRGVIRGSFPVGRLATQLASAGASALSVLTEEIHFQGSLQNLREAAVATGLPCLRKDFIVDEYQLFEAVVNSAAAVLLIAAALADPDFGFLLRRSRELGLDILCEVHDEAEVARAVAIGADLIGVNSRNLRTLEIDMATPQKLAPFLPKAALRIAESGISSADEIRWLRSLGYQAFLVGESLMRAEDAGAALAQLMSGAKAPPIGATGVPGWATGTKD